MDIKRLFILVLSLALSISLVFCLASCDLSNLLKPGAGEGEGDGGGDDEGDNGGDEGGEEGSDPGDEGNGDGGKDDGGEPSGDPDAETPSYPAVTVVKADGTPMSSVIVKLFNPDGTRAGLAATSVDGIAKFDTLSLGNYTVTLDFMTGSGGEYYDESSCVITEENASITIVIFEKLVSKDYTLYGPAFDEKSGKAYSVGSGSYAVKISAGITYFVFTPTKSGTYRISCESNADIYVGNYGIPYYVMDHDISESEGNGFIIEVSPLQGDNSEYTPTVIGLTADDVSDCVLTVERIGDISDNPIFKPWSEITAKMPLTQFTVEEGKTFTSLDLSDPDLKVVLDSDGYYHLGTLDGPLVVVKVAAETKYIASFLTITETSVFGWYDFDENKQFIKKESFNLLIESYAAICDEDLGVCLLTEELAYAIQMNGNYHEWFDFDGNHIFGDDTAFILEENAWLFACGIIE